MKLASLAGFGTHPSRAERSCRYRQRWPASTTPARFSDFELATL